MNSTPKWVTDAYITPWALPNENIAAYVKWDEGMPTPAVTIKTEADVVIHRILNVSDDAWKTFNLTSGKFEIGKTDLQVQGFVGFEARCVTPPNEEKEISFILDFRFEGESVQHVELTTKIVRPILEVQLMTEEIASTRVNPFPRPLNFKLALKGRGDLAQDSLVPTIKAIGGKGLQIKIDAIDGPRESPLLFVRSTTTKRATVSISGRGMGMIVISFSYADRVGNEYSTPLAQVLVNVEEKTKIEVPINNDVDKGNDNLVLTPMLAA